MLIIIRAACVWKSINLQSKNEVAFKIIRMSH